MSLLTDSEIKSIAYDDDTSRGPVAFARAIEAAVIARLATVSVEPCAWVKASEWDDALQKRQSFNGWRVNYGDCNMTLYPAEALAAVRVQENEALRLAYEALETAKGNNGADGYDFEADKQYSRAMDAIRALAERGAG